MGTVPFLPPDNPGRRGRDGEARTEVEVKAAVARSSPSPLPCEGCRSWAHVWTTQAGPCGPRPPISFLISLLKVGGAGTHLACHGLPASKGPSVSTKGATRTCGADYRLRMRLPPQALPRVSVSAWGPGPSLAISQGLGPDPGPRSLLRRPSFPVRVCRGGAPGPRPSLWGGRPWHDGD